MQDTRTSVERRYLSFILLPKVLTLVQAPLRSGALLDIGILGIRHNECFRMNADSIDASIQGG